MTYRPLSTHDLVGVVVALSLYATPSFGQAEPPMETHAFKHVGTLPILADVYKPSGPGPHAVVLWIHGGALILGDRAGLSSQLRDLLLAEGYAICSIDYRLAPATKLSGIHEDVVDAYAWLRREGPAKFSLDPNRIAVMGSSAGGYLTLSGGYLFEPRPAALVSLWGYGDIAGAWYSRPDPFYLKRERISRDVAEQAVRDGMVTESRENRERYKFYLYCRQNGLWPLRVTGVDPHRFPQAYDAWCPLRNITKDYPHTLLVHGDKDTDVPFEQSVLMAAELQRVGIEHRFLTLTGVGHGLGGVDKERVLKVYHDILGFLRPRLAR